MDISQVGNHSIHIFIPCIEVNSYLCLQYFLKKDKEFSFFISRLSDSLIHNDSSGDMTEKDNLEGSR